MKIPFWPQKRVVLKRFFQYSLLGFFTLSIPLTGGLLQTSQGQTKPGFSSMVIKSLFNILGAFAPSLSLVYI